MVRVITFSVLLGIAALFISCSDSNLYGDSDTIKEAKEQWESNSLSNYSMEVDRSCFCGGPLKFRAIVQDGEIVEVIDLETGERSETTVGFRSIDDILNWLEEVASTNPEKLELKFHPTLGYPTFINYNQSDQIADEELLMRIENLEPN